MEPNFVFRRKSNNLRVGSNKMMLFWEGAILGNIGFFFIISHRISTKLWGSPNQSIARIMEFVKRKGV